MIFEAMILVLEILKRVKDISKYKQYLLCWKFPNQK